METEKIFIAIMIPGNGPSDSYRGNASIIPTSSRPGRPFPIIEIKHRSEHGLHSVLPKTNFVNIDLYSTSTVTWEDYIISIHSSTI